MNEIMQTKVLPTTQAAAGVPRLRWTLTEFERLAELGFFREEDHIELIGGELVPLAPKTVRHEVMRGEFGNCRPMRGLPKDLGTAVALGWRVSADTYLEPDFLFYPEARKRDIPWLPPTEVLLAIEIADLSLEFDTTFKAKLYATLGVREYWVVNVVSPATHVYRNPSAGGYAEARTVPASEPLTPLLVPSFVMRLADLRIEK
jgi:Uma2 family endonuclease